MRVGDVRGGWCGGTHRQQAEGKSFRIDLALDAGGAGPSALTLDYDAVLEADTGPARTSPCPTTRCPTARAR